MTGCQVPKPAAALVVCGLVACSLAACGSSRAPSPACERLRPAITDLERETVDYLDWTKKAPAAQRQQGAEAATAAILTACTEGNWSDAAVRCVSDQLEAEKQDVKHPCELPENERNQVKAAINAAEDAAFRRIFGPPPPRPDPRRAFERFANEMERRARQAAGDAGVGRDAGPVP